MKSKMLIGKKTEIGYNMEDAMRDSSENKIFLKVAKEKITFLIKIIEACDNLGVVSLSMPKKGRY